MHAMMECRWGFSAADRHAIKLLKLLGPAAFRVLQEEFGGMRVWVPKTGARFPCAACRARARCARRWREEGKSPAAIGERLGVSVKTVYRLLDGFGAARPSGVRGRAGAKAGGSNSPSERRHGGAPPRQAGGRAKGKRAAARRPKASGQARSSRERRR